MAVVVLDTKSLELPISPPNGWSEEDVLKSLCTVRSGDHRNYNPKVKQPWVEAYANLDYRRFIYTNSLLPHDPGDTLEFGGAPYLATSLFMSSRQGWKPTILNFDPKETRQILETEVDWVDPNGKQRSEVLHGYNFNAEFELLPFYKTFRTVIFCEVFEHFTTDPSYVLYQINQMLKPGGTLIFSTPNALALERFAYQLAGINIQNDKFTKMGPYGRHNREYSLAEVECMMHLHGFIAAKSHTGNTREDHTNNFKLPDYLLANLLAKNGSKMGYFIFGVWHKAQDCQAPQRPAWLYSQYEPEELVMNDSYHLFSF